MTEVIRRAIDRLLANDLTPDQHEIRLRARNAAGRFSDTAKDVARHHDKYLAISFSAEKK